MASLAGGPAEKFGNEYERLWLTKLLLEVISGRALAVRIEPRVPIELKTECIVTRPDRTLECHQCKREHGSAGKWTISSLQAEGVITAADLFLRQSVLHRYHFVSGDRVPSLSTFRQRALKFDQTSDFFAEAASNGPDRSEFGHLARLLSIDVASRIDQLRLLDFLRRMVPVIEDPDQLRGRVEETASCYILGEPANVVTCLETLASTTVRREYRIADLKNHLESRGFQLRDLAQQSNLTLLLDETCNRFERTFKPYLIGGMPIHRTETDQLLSAVNSAAARLILLHGRGGCGKSGVIYEMLEHLRSNMIPCVVLRLDQDRVGRTPWAIGTNNGLPADPVACLTTVSQERPAILIIDQLDAIRWTSQHSASSWDAVSQLISLALAKPSVTVVLACRTHDVNDDPRIRQMIERLEHEKAGVLKLEALPIAIETLDILLTRVGLTASRLTPIQKEILRLPQNLYLWQVIQPESASSSFASGTDLCKAYWAWVREQLTSDQRTELNERVLPTLIEGSFSVGRELVPTDIRSKYAEVVKRLFSIGALTAAGPKAIRFGHQSYFDYVAAEHLADRLRSGAVRLTDWLTRHDSLFHRQQLRQLLEMLRDDDVTAFIGTIKSILNRPDVRFHLKQAALETIASAATPTDAELGMLLGYENDLRLWPHVYGIFHRDVAWFDLLHKRGTLTIWAASDNEIQKNQSRWLMNVFVEQRSDAVIEMIKSTAPVGQTSLFESAVNFKFAGLFSRRMFKKYLELIRADAGTTEHVDIKKLAGRSPRRAIIVFREFVRRVLRSIARGAQEQQDHSEYIIFEASNEMRSIVKQYPRTGWAMFAILVEDVTGLQRTIKRKSLEQHIYPDINDRQLLARLSQFVQQLLIVAGMEISRRFPAAAWSACTPFLKSRSRFRKRIGLYSLGGLHRTEADRVLGLLCTDPTLLTCGANRSNSRYGAAATFPARRMFRRYGAHSSPPVLALLEAIIRTLIPKRERATWKYAHEYFMGTSWYGVESKHNFYPRTTFAYQFLLFEALPIDRLSGPARDWLGVLNRKFGSVSTLIKEPPTSVGGFISSTIPEERIFKMSAKQWLRIITNSAGVAGKSRSIGHKLTLTESTPRMFSGQLQRAAHRDPSTFALMAMKIPLTADLHYIAAVIRALGETKPPQQAPSSWTVAPPTLVEPVLARFQPLQDDRELGMAVGWLFNNRCNEPWTDDAIKNLVEIAKWHPNPQSAEATIFSGDGAKASKPDFVATGINSVRGVAAIAVSALLWNDSSRLNVLRPAIINLENDTHPSVRMSATRIAIPMLNIDRGEAVRLCVALNSHPSEEILRGNELADFLKYALISDFDRLRPLVDRMIASSISDNAKRGAEWSTLMYLHAQKMKSEVSLCVAGSVQQRMGIATILSRDIPASLFDQACLDWSAKLLDDEDETVRRTMAIVLWRPQIYSLSCAHWLLKKFIDSRAFGANIGETLHGLRETTVSLTGFSDLIDLAVHRLTEVATAKGSTVAASSPDLPTVLLRLYEQSEHDPEVRTRCLDILDTALENRFGYDISSVLDS